MNRSFISVAALAALFGALAIRARAHTSNVSATATTSSTQPEPQTPASTTRTLSDDHDELRIIGRIDLTQFRPGRGNRRGRIGGQPDLAA